jgi:ubiquinone/menaquinone biosynthesis C-methylase UbiE
MSQQTVSFSESVPANYDRYMGPMLFEPYADDIAARLEVREGMRVLEIACGTGIVTRHLRERLPASSTLVATDLSEPMLTHAQRQLGGVGGIEWLQADAMALPFPDQSFDAAVCQFGLMFVPDKAAAVREAYRVLKPGGQFLFNTWCELKENDFTLTAHTTVMSFFKTDPPMFYEIPFSLHDETQLESWMREAGFQNVTVRTLNLRSVSPSAADAAMGLVQGTPLAGAIKERGADIDAITAAVAEALAAKFGKDPTRARMCALVCEGIR